MSNVVKFIARKPAKALPLPADEYQAMIDGLTADDLLRLAGKCEVLVGFLRYEASKR